VETAELLELPAQKSFLPRKFRDGLTILDAHNTIDKKGGLHEGPEV